MRAVILIALVIGLIISASQIFIDFSNQKNLPEEDMRGLISIVRDPATSIVFSLDPATANELLRGLLKHQSVTSCQITLTGGTLFASQNRPLAKLGKRKLNDLLFGKTKSHQWDLVWHSAGHIQKLATLEITVDTYHYGQLFFQRAWITLASTLLYALTLTISFLLLFYFLVTRPLAKVIQSISQVNVDALEETRLVEPEEHDDDEIGLLVRLTNKHLEAITLNLAQIRKADEALKQHSDNLEIIVSKRTHALTASLKELQTAQNQLIQSEKLAALGGLVAGVAHEVNTPLGIAVTAASILEETLADMQKQFDAETLTAEGLEKLIGVALDSHHMLTSNISRATKLIGDFKMTAVDQLSETCCEFNIAETISALIESLHPETRKIPVSPVLECPADLTMNSLPGVLTQVLSNLIVNSVRHAFHEVQHPEIQIRIQPDGDLTLIEYRDNGVGVPEELHKRIFEPFFTTKRGRGGSGLGLNIVYNLVTRKLEGRLEFVSKVGEGLNFKLYIPTVLHSKNFK